MWNSIRTVADLIIASRYAKRLGLQKNDKSKRQKWNAKQHKTDRKIMVFNCSCAYVSFLLKLGGIVVSFKNIQGPGFSVSSGIYSILNENFLNKYF